MDLNLQAENIIQIEDRFWPYLRQSDSPPGHDLRFYVEQAKRLFLERRCVQSSFTAADEKLAQPLYRRGVSLIDVEHAILLVPCESTPSSARTVIGIST